VALAILLLGLDQVVGEEYVAMQEAAKRFAAKKPARNRSITK
jgi:hypothetical protein